MCSLNEETEEESNESVDDDKVHMVANCHMMQLIKVMK